jgi:hypothetical protein
MVSRSLKITADTSEEHLVELGIHTRALGDNASEFDKRVQVQLPQVSKLVLNG